MISDTRYSDDFSQFGAIARIAQFPYQRRRNSLGIAFYFENTSWEAGVYTFEMLLAFTISIFYHNEGDTIIYKELWV